MTMRVHELHRAAPLVMALTGERSFAKAEEHLHSLAVHLVLGPSVGDSSALQAAALTIVNAGKRTFRGGIYCTLLRDGPVLSPLSMESRLSDSIRVAGGILDVPAPQGLPAVLIGDVARAPETARIALRVVVEGWKTAVGPADELGAIGRADALPLAGILGASLALSELLALELASHPEAGQRVIGFSLWEQRPATDWARLAAGPALAFLAKDVWLVGLGHLGQGYLWSLTSLPYPRSPDVSIMLQDVDQIGPETLSTGLVCEPQHLGALKTRVAAGWLEARGMRTRVVERLLTSEVHTQSADPHLVLVGVDSSRARVAIADVIARASDGMLALDVGLGSSPADFDELVLHASPFRPDLRQHWLGAQERRRAEKADQARKADLEAIRATNALDACGIVQFDQIAVGVPFVGAAAGAISISEVLRRLAAAPPVETLSVRLRDLPLAVSPTVAAPAAATINFVRYPGDSTGCEGKSLSTV